MGCSGSKAKEEEKKEEEEFTSVDEVAKEESSKAESNAVTNEKFEHAATGQRLVEVLEKLKVVLPALSAQGKLEVAEGNSLMTSVSALHKVSVAEYGPLKNPRLAKLNSGGPSGASLGDMDTSTRERLVKVLGKLGKIIPQLSQEGKISAGEMQALSGSISTWTQVATLDVDGVAKSGTGASDSKGQITAQC
eukprot:m.16137 g.16137  ORF g.16137 m.16137 type:complete len:192 (+) comp5589_c0_seq2:185-760(+)